MVVAQVVELLDHESRGPEFESSRRAGLFVLFVALCSVTLTDTLRRCNTIGFSKINEFLAAQLGTFLNAVFYLSTEVSNIGPGQF